MMGCIVTMKCHCGYAAKAAIGSGKRDCETRSLFPHYCFKCGVVSVNLREAPIACPDCDNQNVVRYGEICERSTPRVLGFPLKKRMTEVWRPAGFVTQPFGLIASQGYDYRLSEGDHFCPGCQQFSLSIDAYAVSFFD